MRKIYYFAKFISICMIVVSFSSSVSFAETMIFRMKDVGPVLMSSAKIGDKKLGHQPIIANLQNRATFSQSDIIAVVEKLKAEGKITSYKQFWITNAISITGNYDELIRLSQRADVESAVNDAPVSLIAPVDISGAESAATGAELGLRVIKAPDAWSIGLTGAGSLVCNFDTGVFGNHPALMSKYRGNNGGTVSESWFDPYSNTNYPIDNNGHGTHTMGTMLGSDGADTIGVAPGAQWIAAAVVDRGGGIQRTISDILSAFQWVADPDGDPNTTNDVPDVVNNSWGIPLGYYPACEQTFWEAIDNLEAVGVVCLFAAGNEGPTARTIRTPADRISSDFNSFSVGAVDGSSQSLTIATFSSRGPSGCDGITIKPEVSAPGVAVRSSSRLGGYASMSGTSMATPHVAGAVAILRQFNPSATPAQIKQALMYSARDLGQAGEDNTYGWGVIDIRRALYYMPPPDGLFPVFISETVSGNGVAFPGETFSVRLRIENIGRPASTVAARLISNDSRATVLTSDIAFGPVDHIDTVEIGPFDIEFANSINNGEIMPFQLLLTSGSWHGTVNFTLVAGGEALPGVASHYNDLLSMSFSNFGQFGLGPGSLNPQGGIGFKFPSSGADLLRNGSLILATNSSHVSDGAISSNPNITDNDFAPVAGGYPRVLSPGPHSDQDGYSSYSDAAAESPIGLNISQKSFCWIGSGSRPFVIFEFTIKNTTPNAINSLFAGLYCDWDLPLTSGNDDNVGYIDYESLGYMQDPATGLAVGIKSITSNASSYAAINNNSVISDGFTDLEKFNLMTSGFSFTSNSSPDNYSHLLTVGPYSIASGDSEVVAFSFVAGNSLQELIASADQSFWMYPGLTGISENTVLPERNSIISNYPNPFNSSTVISISGPLSENGAIGIYDIIGRLVKRIDLNGKDQTVWNGTDDNGQNVSSGMYFARLLDGNGGVKKMILMK